MAKEQCKDYLATRVFIDQKPVTYRLLSRAVKTDVNTAKWMLFDFHQKKNAKKPNSVHATYLISGSKRSTDRANERNGHDGNMCSSPFMSSMPQPEQTANEVVKKTSIILVREEELKDVRAQFEETSIHIYSLESGPIENLNVLSTCNYEISSEYPDEDPMQRWRTYGSIQNSFIKRRTAKYAPPVPAPGAKQSANPVTKPATTTGVENKEATIAVGKPRASEDNTSARPSLVPSAGPTTLKRADSKPGAKRGKAASDFFKSFPKTAPKAAGKVKESAPAPAEDDAMQGMSEDEGDADDEPQVKLDEEKNEAARKAREERAERLRKMMEDDDEDMPDAPVPDAAESPSATTPLETTETPDTTDAASPAPAAPSATTENTRRRGRRRVTKQKKVKDEDGYLVTREETVWESFSEDEPETKKKLVPAKMANAANAAKGKPVAKKGQGSIASFFKKA